ncbi:RNA polymerase sigma factor [Chloroflexota bacterium]
MIDSIPTQLEQDDALLIEKAQNGDVNAFGELYERYAATLFRFIYSQTLDRLDAEDITADVFLKAWQALPNYKDQGFSFSPYLFRIARNTLIDSRRKPKLTKDISENAMMNIPDKIASEPGALMFAKTQHNDLVMILSQLREDYRTVLILRFFNDLSPEEIAQVMGRSVGAIRVLQHRALSSLRKLIPSQSFDL